MHHCTSTAMPFRSAPDPLLPRHMDPLTPSSLNSTCDNTFQSSCAGVWGNLVRQWLNEVLPNNAADLCR